MPGISGCVAPSPELPKNYRSCMASAESVGWSSGLRPGCLVMKTPRQFISDRMHRDICSKGFDNARNTFTQSYNRPELDASLLLISRVGFLPGDDPRVKGTIEAVERELLVDGFVLRYRTDGEDDGDGLPPGEGAFLPCSFWLVDAYALEGRRDKAEALFERLIGLVNDVGLLSEEYDSGARRQVGNFPQAFSHLALLSSAMTLEGANATQERQH